MNNLLLEARHVVKLYRSGSINILALRGVNLQVYRGEIVAIMGPSGCGKSTLLNLLGGLDKPTRGEILFEGRNMVELSDNELTQLRLRNIGFIFQSYNLIPTLTARENIELPLALLGYPKDQRCKRSNMLLDMVGLGEKSNRFPHELSGGEQQRVAIARALANQPSIVLADEPTGNLDSQNSRALMKIIRSLRDEQDQTFIIATHNLEVATYTDRIIMLKDGVIIRDSSNSKIIEISRTSSYP